MGEHILLLDFYQKSGILAVEKQLTHRKRTGKDEAL